MIKPLKKIEIVVQSRMLNRLLDRLAEANIYNYTVLEILKGRGGKHGESFGDGLVPHGNDTYLFTICTEDEQIKAFTVLENFFMQHGGLCMSSDVNCLKF
jgi:nitrogen regulatory protein PII